MRCEKPYSPSSELDHEKYQECMSVRYLKWGSNGKLEPNEAWMPWYSIIQGYQRINGRQNILRVKRYRIENPDIHGATSFDELDMVMASSQ